MTEGPFLDKRSSRRVPIALPVECEIGGVRQRGMAALVNDRGALLLMPAACPPGAILDVRNLETGAVAKFRVVWCAPDPTLAEFTHRTGVASIGHAARFWGPTYRNPDETLPPGRLR